MIAYEAAFVMSEREDSSDLEDYISNIPGIERVPRRRELQNLRQFEIVVEGEFVIQFSLIPHEGSSAVKFQFAMCSDPSVDGRYIDLLLGVLSNFEGTIWLDFVGKGLQWEFKNGDEELLMEVFLSSVLELRGIWRKAFGGKTGSVRVDKVLEFMSENRE